MRIVCEPWWKPAESIDEVRRADASRRVDGRTLVAIDISPLGTLAHNLSIVGALFASFRAGDSFGFHMGADESQCTCQWSPGHGEPYRGLTRCEQDEVYDPDDPLGCCARHTWGDELHDPWCDGGQDNPPTPGPNGCTCGNNGDCNCSFVP